MELNKALTDALAKLMQSPKVLAFATHPSVMQAAMAVMNLRGQVSAQLSSLSLSVARAMDLATRSEVIELRRTVRKLQEKLSKMEAAQRKSRGAAHDDDD